MIGRARPMLGTLVSRNAFARVQKPHQAAVYIVIGFTMTSNA